MSVLSSLKLLFLSRRYSQQLTDPLGIRPATRDDQRSTDLEEGKRDFRETVLHLFVGQELEGLRWKHLAEGTWKGFGTIQNRGSKSGSLVPKPGSRRQGRLNSRGVQGLSWRDGSV